MNWGTKIVLGMVAFMIFIIAMVVYMFSVHGNDALVDEDYYEKGMNYNQEYDAKQNVTADHADPLITINRNQVVILLRDSASYELKMMRPSTTKDDIKATGTTVGDSNLILLSTKKMVSGLWFMELKWKSKGKPYQFSKNITL